MSFPQGYPFFQLPAGNQSLQLLDNVFAALGFASNIACSTAGTANGIALTPLTNFFLPTAYTTGLTVTFVATATSTGAVTIQVGGLPALPAFTGPTGTSQIQGGGIGIGGHYTAIFDSAVNGGLGGWVVSSNTGRFSPAITIDSGQGTTAQARLWREIVQPFNTSNDNMPGASFTLSANTAAAGDFSTAVSAFFTAINYDESFNGGGQAFFWNPPTIPIGQDGTAVSFAENFTVLAKHRLDLDRPQCTATLTGTNVTSIAINSAPPYPYAAAQGDIRVTLYQDATHFVQGYATADGSGVLTAATGWYTVAGNPGGPKLLPTSTVAFSSTPGVFLQPPSPPNATVTISIASPAVVTWTGHGRSIGDPIVFTTTGALPTGLLPGTPVWIITAGFGANSFEVSNTPGGAAINTTGSQSGVQTAFFANVRFDGGPVLAVARDVSNPGNALNPVAGSAFGNVGGTTIGPMQFAITDGAGSYVAAQQYVVITSTIAQGAEWVWGTHQAFGSAQTPDAMRLGQGLRLTRSDGVTYADQGYGTFHCQEIFFSDTTPVTPVLIGTLQATTGISLFAQTGKTLGLGINGNNFLFQPSAVGDVPANSPMAFSGSANAQLGMWANRTASNGDTAGTLGFFTGNSIGTQKQFERIVGTSNNATNGAEEGLLIFQSQTGGAIQTQLQLNRGNVVCGPSSVASTATDGFTYIASVNADAAPTGVPTAYTGHVPMVWRPTTFRLYIFDVGANAWKSVLFA